MSEAINLGLRLFIDADGFTHPIVQMLDCEGDECEPCDAVAAVAGSGERWFSIDLSHFNAGVYQ